MKLIALTLADDRAGVEPRPVHINPEAVDALEPHRTGTSVLLRGRDKPLFVSESPEQVEQLVEKALQHA